MNSVFPQLLQFSDVALLCLRLVVAMVFFESGRRHAGDPVGRAASIGASPGFTRVLGLGEMAAVVAHEVRNPLAGLRGALQILSQRLQDERSERGVILEMIKRLDALNDRVNDMLRYAKPRSPELTRVPLRTLLEATADLARRDPAMTGLEIEVEGGELAARGDPEMLREVFLNLILNAGQAMEGSGTVRVLIEGDKTAVVRIADSGPGMSEDLLERIFEPFFTTKRAGTGLGLAIVRRLLELQEGRVDVQSTSPAGTTIRVTLPLAPGSSA